VKKYYLLFLIPLLIHTKDLLAQKKTKQPEESLTGKNIKEIEHEISTLSKNDNNRIESDPKSKTKIVQIYIRSSQNLGLGNICVEKVLKDFELQFVIIPKLQGEISGTDIFFHNLGANFKLYFRKGLRWKHKLLQQIEDCKVKTGDRVG